MAFPYTVDSRVGRLIASDAGENRNRITHYLSRLADGWLATGRRPSIHLPAPVGGWMRYALTVTPEAVYARCQRQNASEVKEEIFRAPKALAIREAQGSGMRERWRHYREALDHVYGWPAVQGAPWAPFPSPQAFATMDTLYRSFGSVTLLLSHEHLVVTSYGHYREVWGSWPGRELATDFLKEAREATCIQTQPYQAINCYHPLEIKHAYRWWGYPGDAAYETHEQLHAAAMLLSEPSPLSGTRK